MTVLEFLIRQCRLRRVRISVRLFVDKAIPDYKLWKMGRTETHWKDLIVSEIEQQLVELTNPKRDLSRADAADADRWIAAEITLKFPGRRNKAKRIEEWIARTGKSEKQFYRRQKEAERAGLIRETPQAQDDEDGEE